jgi:NAD(P)H-nitrite reductase large subunit
MNAVRNSNRADYVIIGNSVSGIAAIEAIRECDKKGKILVISDESYFNYSRPLISYLLGKKIGSERMSYRGRDFYQDNNVELILNKRATELGLRRREVVLRDSQKIKFDKLLIATGGVPIMPEIKGSELGGVFTFTKLADAQDIEKYIKARKVKQAIVIGGGLIGLKATEALVGLKIKVTIIELADRILSATFDKKASNIIQRALEKVGCKLITNNTVVEIKGNKKVKAIILKDKKKIPADLVIVAIGVRPNIELVKNTPIKTNKGILVDRFMQTNIKHVYAAGDCCEARNLLLDVNQSIAIWPVAAKQGKIAGYNMVGIKKEYPGSFLMNSVELCGIPTISVGQIHSEGEGYQILEYFSQVKPVYKKIILKHNKIIGAIFIGDIERAGIYTGLIKDKVDTNSFKEHLLKEDFGLISLPSEYRKHLVAGRVAII